MKARPRATLFLKIMIPALAVMVPVAAFGVALDYAITCGKFVGCVYSPPAGSTTCGTATDANYAPQWLQQMSNEFANQVNTKIPGYGSGTQKIGVYDSSLLQVCNKPFNPKCSDQYPAGINSQGAGLIALHGSSSPVSNSTTPTFTLYFSAYQTNNNISGVGDCWPQMFGKMYLGLPSLKFLFVLSCDSMNVSNDLPSASNQLWGWLFNTWGVHTISGFSGIDHTGSGTGDMDDFVKDQKSLGIGHSWMNHFTKFSPTGNDTITGASDCAVSMMLGNTVSDAASRWSETMNSPMPNPQFPTGALQVGYYCGCCSDYGGSEGKHCTPSC